MTTTTFCQVFIINRILRNNAKCGDVSVLFDKRDTEHYKKAAAFVSRLTHEGIKRFMKQTSNIKDKNNSQIISAI